LEANTKAKGVASLPTLEFENQGEQLVVITKLANLIIRGTNLKLTPLPIIIEFPMTKKFNNSISLISLSL